MMARANRFIFSPILAALLLVLCFCCSVVRAEPASPGARRLLSKYPEIKGSLEKNPFNTPIHVDSTETKNSLGVDVYSVLTYPFDTVRAALQSPANWCDIASLHINIKACTSTNVGTERLLTLYSGHKHYQPPADAYRLNFKFYVAENSPRYLDIRLAAANGPLFTKDHRIGLEAAPLEKGKTFVRFSYTYSYGAPARAAIKSYFATIARDKVGFSIAATDKAGRPVYIRGVRGAIERNAVRYYLALQAYMDTAGSAESLRFQSRIVRWYYLTAKYPRQLHEMEMDEYLAMKGHEHHNQLLLQREQDGS